MSEKTPVIVAKRPDISTEPPGKYFEIYLEDKTTKVSETKFESKVEGITWAEENGYAISSIPSIEPDVVTVTE
jgi:hypothetical protein